MVIALLLVGALVAPFTGTALPADPAVVRTEAGSVRGTVHDGYRTFEGVPYAAPPTGELRWRPPQPARSWPGVRDATAPGPDCAQNTAGYGGPRSGSEDCLTLNVTTPAAGGELRPVVVWLHGGSFQAGSGRQYDAHRLAVQGGTVVITVNYRLGVFGFLGLPGLPGSGTFGLLDQQAALRWVRRNAAAFGGDPHNVTLAGQSAGGMSVCSHLTSPSAAGLFDKAVIQSGSCLTDWPDDLFYPGIPAGSQWSPVSSVRAAGQALATELSCAGDPLGCLRAQSADTLLQATEGAGVDSFLSPAYGTALLPRHPAEAVRAGAFQRVPVLSGHTRDEARSFIGVLDLYAPVTAQRYEEVLATAFGADAGAVLAEYPLGAYDTPGQAWSAVATDRIWACPTREGNRLLGAHTAVYAYEFAETGGPVPFPGYDWGAYHGSELPFLFDVTYATGPRDEALAGRMVAAWSTFATTGRAPWPRARVQVLTSAAPEPSDHHCAFWSAL